MAIDDCNDYDGTVHPGVVELCDGIDNDCNGAADAPSPFGGASSPDYELTHSPDVGGPVFGPIAMVAPTVINMGDDHVQLGVALGFQFEFYGVTWLELQISSNGFVRFEDRLVNPGCCEGLPIPVDDDLDNIIAMWWQDLNAVIPTTAEIDTALRFTYAAPERDIDGDGYRACNDCDDENPDVRPNQLDLCDGVDSDCDGSVDEEGSDFNRDGVCDLFDTCPFVADGTELDTDGDGLGDACDVCPLDDPDDSDGDGSCDTDDLCDGDDASGDADADGVCDDTDPCFGDQSSPDVDGDGACTLATDGRVYDCDDTAATVYPGAPELCDGLDNACAGATPDEDADVDEDGHSICAGDCDDTEAGTYPAAVELCDDIDSDCDGTLNNGAVDTDGDGVCDELDPSPNGDADDDGVCDDVDACAGFDDGDDSDHDGVAFGCDCNDLDATMFDGAPELCDGLDNDCDGSLPDDETDADGDRVLVCEGDCDDADNGNSPLLPEFCHDGLDNNCDDQIDEDCAELTAEGLLDDQGGCYCSSTGSAGFGWLGLVGLMALRRRRTPLNLG